MYMYMHECIRVQICHHRVDMLHWTSSETVMQMELWKETEIPSLTLQSQNLLSHVADYFHSWKCSWSCSKMLKELLYRTNTNQKILTWLKMKLHSRPWKPQLSIYWSQHPVILGNTWKCPFFTSFCENCCLFWDLLQRHKQTKISHGCLIGPEM